MTAVTEEGPIPVTAWKRLLRVGLAMQCVAAGGFLAWAFTARLDGGAVATGVVAVESYKKAIQHLEGGIVGQILVRDGDLVQSGDVLVRLDPTRAQAALTLYRQQLAAALAQEAKLVAERDLADTMQVVTEATEWRSDPHVARALQDQENSFRSRRASLDQQISIANTQVAQIEKEIEALEVESRTAQAQLEFVSKELIGLRSLMAKQLVPLNRLNTMERDELALKGSVARSKVEMAKANQRIVETRLRAAQIRQEYQQEAAKQLPELRRTIGDLRQQIVVAEDAIKRIDVFSPNAGRVQELKVFTVGGVIRPGDTLMSIVPTEDNLIIKAQISPLDAEKVRAGMMAEIVFSSFKSSVRELTLGRVRAVSGDRQIDEGSKEPFFSAEVEIDSATIPEHISKRLIAGLPVDVVIPTGERSAIGYLLAPISERLFKALREE